MQGIKSLNRFIILEKYDVVRKPKSTGESPFKSPFTVETNDNLAVVKVLPESENPLRLKVGDKVFYGKDYQTLVINGVQVFAMTSDNIIALSEEASDDQAL